MYCYYEMSTFFVSDYDGLHLHYFHALKDIVYDTNIGYMV